MLFLQPFRSVNRLFIQSFSMRCIRPCIWIDPEMYEVQKQSTLSFLVYIETADSSPSATFTVSTDSNSGDRSWKVRPWDEHLDRL